MIRWRTVLAVAIAVVLIVVVAIQGMASLALQRAERNDRVAREYLLQNFPDITLRDGTFGPRSWTVSTHMFRGTIDGEEVEIEILVDRGRPETVAVKPASVTQPEPVRMVRAILTIGGIETELRFQRYGDNVVYDLPGELILEFDGPVNLDSLGSDAAQYEYANTEKASLKRTVPKSTGWVVFPVGLEGADGMRVVFGGARFELTRIPGPGPTVKRVSLLRYPDIIMEWEPFALAPGEILRIEFNTGDFRAEIDEHLSGSVRSSVTGDAHYHTAEPAHRFTWESDKVLLFSVDDYTRQWVIIGHPVFNFALEIVPLQQVVVLGDNKDVLSRTPVPLSITGIMEMDEGFRTVRVIRPSEGVHNWSGSTAYTLDLTSGELTGESKRLPMFSWNNWTVSSQEARSRVGQYGACGLSFDGRWLAVYRSDSIQIVDMAGSTEVRTLAIPPKPMGMGDFASPQWIHWSFNSSRVFYNAPLRDDYGPPGLFALDLNSGEETLLGTRHSLLQSSPYGELLFSVVEPSGHQNVDNDSAYYLLDFTGRETRLGKPGEHLTLTKWIDQKRILINVHEGKRYARWPSGQKCYIYHIDDGSWQYVADGYGFDYDVKTGRAFLLQTR